MIREIVKKKKCAPLEWAIEMTAWAEIDGATLKLLASLLCSGGVGELGAPSPPPPDVPPPKCDPSWEWLLMKLLITLTPEELTTLPSVWLVWAPLEALPATPRAAPKPSPPRPPLARTEGLCLISPPECRKLMLGVVFPPAPPPPLAVAFPAL